MTIFIIVREN